MHLVQLLLPLYDNRGNRLNKALFRQDELVIRAHPIVRLWQA
jgi:hypothetical protein